MVLSTQNLSLGYGGAATVSGVNLTLESGEWLSLVGANGSGKSTFLKGISRLLSPLEGVVWLSGRDVHQLPSAVVARQLALLPQQQPIPPGLTVQQLVSLGRAPHQPWWRWDLTPTDQAQVNQALDWTELTDYCDRTVSDLSGGERQRAFLALALAQNPRVLLLDEPTTFLDIHYQLQLLTLLQRLNQQHQLTIITVLHDINLAARYSDRIALMRQGRLWAVGPPAEMLTPPLMQDVFEVEVAVISTPVGLQICPLAATTDASRSESLVSR